MKKIRLDVEELEVHSFETETMSETHGTVRGRQDTDGCDPTGYYVCFMVTEEYDTCYESGDTCGASCDWVCYPASRTCPDCI